MLTGLHPPTSGTITVNGRNLQTDLSAIRRELGVCLQQDVLFDNLTVLEHLVLFAAIKAPQWTRKELCQQVNRLAPAVSLVVTGVQRGALKVPLVSLLMRRGELANCLSLWS